MTERIRYLEEHRKNDAIALDRLYTSAADRISLYLDLPEEANAEIVLFLKKPVDPSPKQYLTQTYQEHIMKLVVSAELEVLALVETGIELSPRIHFNTVLGTVGLAESI